MAGTVVGDLKIGRKTDGISFKHLHKGMDGPSGYKHDLFELKASSDMSVPATNLETVDWKPNRENAIEENEQRPDVTKHSRDHSEGELWLEEQDVDTIRNASGDAQYSLDISFKKMPSVHSEPPLQLGSLPVGTDQDTCPLDESLHHPGSQVLDGKPVSLAKEQIDVTQSPWESQQRHLENGAREGPDPPLQNCSQSGDPADMGVGCGTELDQQLLNEVFKQQSTCQFTERFSLSDIAENPNLVKAAKLELSGKPVAMVDDADALSDWDAQSRVTDLERIRFTSDTADRDAQREGQAGVEEVEVVLKRLELGHKYFHIYPVVLA